jgi:thiamine biosynthesis lipoprotein
MGSELHLLSLTRKKMATDFQFEVVVERARVAAAESTLHEAFDVVESIESAITEFREDSPVARLNRSQGEWIDCPQALIDLIRMSLRTMQETQGYFDPFAKTPPGVERGRDGSELEVDLEARRIRRHAEIHLGFGAIGKGYALDAVSALLERNGESDFRLNCGGSSWVFSGLDPLGEAWKIGWAWEKDAEGDYVGKTFSLPKGKSLSIGISGTLEKGAHLLHQGVSRSTRVLSALYSGRSAAESDAFSTALFVGAGIEGEGILTRLGSALRNPAMAYVDLEGEIVYNRNFENVFSG